MRDRVHLATRCLGSGCSQWRWGEPKIERFRTRPTYREVAPEEFEKFGTPSDLHDLEGELINQPEGEGWRIVDEDDEGTRLWERKIERPRRHGYCGRAPKPEFDD